MATGPEHYREAERFLGYAVDWYHGGDLKGSITAAHIAQVHATLAQTAAVAGMDAHEGGPGTGRTVEEANEWARAIAPLVPAPCVECESTGQNCLAHRVGAS